MENNKKIRVLVTPSDTSGVGSFRSINPHLALEAKYPDLFHVDIDYHPKIDDEEFLKQYDIIHYHRTLGPYENMDKLNLKLKELGIIAIMDLDDYWSPGTHHPAYHLIKNAELDKKLVENLKIAHHITTTTDIFANEISKLNKNVSVLPNAINPKEKQFIPNLEPSNGRLRVGWLGGSCLTPDTEILSEKGWVLLPDLKEGIKVATLNTTSNQIEYHIPTGYIKQEHKGDIYVCETEDINFKVTGNHNMYVAEPTNGKIEYKLVCAEDTWGKDFYYKKDNSSQVLVTKEQLTKEAYDGYVYCVEVQNHIIYVRRNGKTMWVGNSHLKDLEILQGVVSKLKVDNLLDKVQFVLCGFDLRGTHTDIDSVTKEHRQRAILPKESVWYRYEQIFTDDYKSISPEYKDFLLKFKQEDYPNVKNEPYRRVWTKNINSYATSYNLFDVSLAPLEKNIFNQVKSQLKLIEAGFFSKAVIAQDFGPYNIGTKNALQYGGGFDETANAILIDSNKNHKDWYSAIKKLINNPEMVKTLQTNLHDSIKNEYSIDKVSEDRKNLYLELIEDKNSDKNVDETFEKLTGVSPKRVRKIITLADKHKKIVQTNQDTPISEDIENFELNKIK